MFRKLSLFALISCAAPAVALATEPTAPVELDDAARLLELDLVLSDGLTVREVAVTQVFNRFQGRVVDLGARMIGEFAVRRALDVVDLGRGRARVSLAPVPEGQRLPDGIYSQLLEIEAQPFDPSREPFTILHPIYFEVAGGAVRRIDMPTYSERVEPTQQGADKFGRPAELHGGLSALAPTPPVGEAADLQVERGDAFALPGDERNEN